MTSAITVHDTKKNKATIASAADCEECVKMTFKHTRNLLKENYCTNK